MLQALKIHHRITQIHPFRDGNGRSSRAMLNWILRKKRLPPIYFKLTEGISFGSPFYYAENFLTVQLIVLNYAIVMYDKSKSKIEIVQEIANGLHNFK